MNYKEQTFEIDNGQIKSENKLIIPLFIGTFAGLSAFGLIMYSRETITLLSWLSGSILGLSLLIFFFSYSKIGKTRISLSDISYIEVLDYINEHGKPIFHGTGNFKNFFPAGLNKKVADKLILIHQENKKIIIGLVPDNYDVTISALRANGINVVENN
jgi:hypothetical protein